MDNYLVKQTFISPRPGGISYEPLYLCDYNGSTSIWGTKPYALIMPKHNAVDIANRFVNSDLYVYGVESEQE